MRVALESDVRPILPTISVPVLVAYLRDSPEASGSNTSQTIFPVLLSSEVPGADDYWWASDASGAVLDEIEEFVTGARGGHGTDRHLATLLFTDIVASTAHTSDGRRALARLLDRHDLSVRRQLARFRGNEVNTTGDGFVSTFDGPARAVECAYAIRDSARQLGLEVRSGVHTGGEVEMRPRRGGHRGPHRRSCGGSCRARNSLGVAHRRRSRGRLATRVPRPRSFMSSRVCRARGTSTAPKGEDDVARALGGASGYSATPRCRVSKGPSRDIFQTSDLRSPAEHSARMTFQLRARASPTTLCPA